MKNITSWSIRTEKKVGCYRSGSTLHRSPSPHHRRWNPRAVSPHALKQPTPATLLARHPSIDFVTSNANPHFVLLSAVLSHSITSPLSLERSRSDTNLCVCVCVCTAYVSTSPSWVHNLSAHICIYVHIEIYVWYIPGQHVQIVHNPRGKCTYALVYTLA